jgi:hypothetical protein
VAQNVESQGLWDWKENPSAGRGAKQNIKLKCAKGLKSEKGKQTPAYKMLGLTEAILATMG